MGEQLVCGRGLLPHDGHQAEPPEAGGGPVEACSLCANRGHGYLLNVGVL